MAKVVGTSSRPTDRQIRAGAPFGLELRLASPAPMPGAASVAARVREALPRGGVAFLAGPSGSGKSTAMRELAERLRRDEQRVVVHGHDPVQPGRLIDLFGLEVGPIETLRETAAFGLAEPALVARTVEELSEGQRHRASLARSFHRAVRERARWLLIDEFASVLDRVTAFGLAATIRRAARRFGVRVVCASAQDDLLATLRPDLCFAFDLSGGVCQVAAATASRDGPGVTIEQGSQADMDVLLPHHYVAGRPATRVGFLRAFDRTHGNLAGVLVVSMPTLNGAWREQAWPGRYAGRDRKAAAARINAELRCISRVIVDPRYRGLGIATRLVRAYLDAPMSPATEAVAAMGAICPFFERAGMSAYRVPMHKADARLADAVEAAGFEPWMLADAERAGALAAHPLLAAELARWARARRVMADSMQGVCRVAGARLCVTPMAYAAVSPPVPVAFEAARSKGGRHDDRQATQRTDAGGSAAEAERAS